MSQLNNNKMDNPQCAEYNELVKLGIKRTINLGVNAFGFIDKIIELNDGTQYNYIPEDQLYERRDTYMSIHIS